MKLKQTQLGNVKYVSVDLKHFVNQRFCLAHSLPNKFFIFKQRSMQYGCSASLRIWFWSTNNRISDLMAIFSIVLPYGARFYHCRSSFSFRHFDSQSAVHCFVNVTSHIRKRSELDPAVHLSQIYSAIQVESE